MTALQRLRRHAKYCRWAKPAALFEKLAQMTRTNENLGVVLQLAAE
jgi:hypothetical protein